MTSKILLKFAKKGINLSPRAYEKINTLEDPLDFSSSLIVKLKSQEFTKDDLMSLDEKIVEEFITTLGLRTDEEDDAELKSQKELLNYDSKNSEDLSLNKSKNQIKNKSKQSINQKIESKTKISPENKKIKPESKIQTENKRKTNTDEKTKSKTKIHPENKEKTNTDEKTKSKTKIQTENKEKTNINEEIKPKTNIQSENNKIKSKNNIKNDNNKVIVENNEEIAIDSNIPSSNNIKEKIKKFSPNDSIRNKIPYNEEKFDFEIIQDTSKKSYTSGEIGNLITYFNNRYEKISGILSKRPDLKTYQKIRDLEENTKDLNLIVMIKEIRLTKNGHYLVEFEDDTGEIPVLFHSDNHELFREAEKLVKDEVVGIIAEKKGTLAIANRIIKPGVPRIQEKKMDFAAVFTSDIHIGSLTFLEDAFKRFTDWINGDFGNENQKEIANDIKYMIVAGDIVDGIGIYPNQDLELAIKDIREQYEEAARLLGDIRSDVKIIISPGNHDASRVGEPQPAIPEEYAKPLHELNNIEFVSNPSVISLDGWNTLIYHGRGIDDIAMRKGFSHERNDLIMEEMLKRRHLAPIYGERTPLVSELEDYLVIDNIPDILHTGHVHINTYKNYHGVHMINSGTFQTQTEFQKIYNIVPTCAEVPVLHKGVYKQLKFI